MKSINIFELDETPYEQLSVGLRLFTQSPYPEFDYIVTPVEHEFCANQSLFTYLRRGNYWLKWLDVSADQVLEYVVEQISILRYNNPKASKAEVLLILSKIFRWGSENPIGKIAFDTISSTLNELYSVDNYQDIINYTYKTVWYSDRVMKPIRIQGESWKEYTERLRQTKVKARVTYRNQEAQAIVNEESNTYQVERGGIIPTPQILFALTEIPVRKIREVSEEDIIWQSKTKMNMQIIRSFQLMDPSITQLEIAEALGMTDRQVRKIIKTLK